MMAKCFVLILSILPVILSQYSLLFNLKPNIHRIFLPLRIAQNFVEQSRNRFQKTNNFPAIGHNTRYDKLVPPAIVPTYRYRQRNKHKSKEARTKLIKPDYIKHLCLDYRKSIDLFQRKLYLISFETLVRNNHQANGVSFVQSGVLVYLIALALSLSKGHSTQKCSYEENISFINRITKYLPISNENLTFHWSSRVVLAPHIKNINIFQNIFKHLQINQLNSTANVKDTLNGIIEADSLGSLTNTFVEDDFPDGLQAALLSSVYFRSQWRVSPTLLNGSLPFFKDGIGNDTKQLNMKAIRINDIMGYADLQDWNAEVLEIQYATPGLTFLAIIPRGTSLKDVVKRIANSELRDITKKLQEKRISVSMPVYTLRMTLLLPEKLRAIGFPELLKQVNESNSTLKLSHGVQGIMFWADAGRNTYKDDGLMWDQKPDLELSLNRPYAFFIRWNGITIFSGNFVH